MNIKLIAACIATAGISTLAVSYLQKSERIEQPALKQFHTEEVTPSNVANHAGRLNMDKEAMLEHLGTIMKGVNISPANMVYHPSVDMYQILLQGEMFYITGNGSALIRGNVLDVGMLWESPERADLTKEYERAIAYARQSISKSRNEQKIEFVESKEERMALLSSLSSETSVNFPAYGAAVDTLYVFFDISCPACNMFYDEVPALQELGYDVRLVLIARNGRDTGSYNDAQRVVCQHDPVRALNLYVQKGYGTFTQQCEGDISSNQLAFDKLGLQGTPYIYSGASGEVFKGLHRASVIHDRLSSL